MVVAADTATCTSRVSGTVVDPVTGAVTSTSSEGAVPYGTAARTAAWESTKAATDAALVWWTDASAVSRVGEECICFALQLIASLLMSAHPQSANHVDSCMLTRATQAHGCAQARKMCTCR